MSAVRGGRIVNRAQVAREVPRFYSVADTARMLGMSAMTLYREIADGRFPAIRVRSRLVVPAKAIDEMVDAAMDSQGEVQASDWVAGRDAGVA